MKVLGIAVTSLMALHIPVEGQTHLRLRLQVGEALGPAEYTFHSISDVAIGTDGRIFVLDGGDKVVKVYSSSGIHLVTFGGEGSGPGEFIRPTSILIENTAVAVVDAQQGRVSRFTLEGEHLSTTRFPHVDGLGFSNLWPLREQLVLGKTLYRASVGSSSHDPFVRVVAFGTPEGKADTVASFAGSVAVWHAGGQAPWGLAPSQLGEQGAVAVAGDSLVAIVDGYGGKIRIYSAVEGKLLIRWEGSLGAVGRPLTQSDRNAMESEYREQRAAAGHPLPRDIDWIFPTHESAISGAAFFAGELLWIKKRRPGTNDWFVLDLRDNQIRRVALPGDFRPLSGAGSRLAGSWRTEEGYPRVGVFEITSSR